MVAAAEAAAISETGRTDLLALRLAAEFVGPVPVADVTVTARVVRAARTAVLVETSVAAEDRECLRGQVWLVRVDDTSAIAPALDPESPLPTTPPDPPSGIPYIDSIEWVEFVGGLNTPGPGAAWARPRLLIVDDLPLSGLQRAALVGDSASGLSSELDWSVWSFLNVDLDVHLGRPMHGDWLHMAAATRIGPAGSGLARSVLSDVRGELGCTAQTLVVEPIRG